MSTALLPVRTTDPTPALRGLVLNGVGKSFAGRPVFESVSAQFPPGQIVRVTGPSGSGKSTLLSCIGMLDTFDAGEAAFEGAVLDPRPRPRRALLRDTVGFLFQDYGLVDSWTALRNVRLAEPKSRASEGDGALKALEHFDVAHAASRPVHSLSGGEQQRVAMARLLVKAPRLILADEPTSALDDRNADTVSQFLKSQRDAGATVVLATHDARLEHLTDAELDLTGVGQASP